MRDGGHAFRSSLCRAWEYRLGSRSALGTRYVLDVPGGTTVWPLEPVWTSPEYQGFGRPLRPRLRDGQRRTMEEPVMN